jgi:hypothetical protein
MSCTGSELLGPDGKCIPLSAVSNFKQPMVLQSKSGLGWTVSECPFQWKTDFLNQCYPASTAQPPAGEYLHTEYPNVTANSTPCGKNIITMTGKTYPELRYSIEQGGSNVCMAWTDPKSCTDPACDTNATCVAGVCVCPGTSGTAPNVVHCSGHGTCDPAGTGKCTCDPGWSDVDCGTATECPVGPKGKPCSGQGVCNKPVCVCNPGWSTANCSVGTCPGTTPCNSAKSQGVCNNTTGQCTCASGWSGSDCGTKTCPGSGTPVTACTGTNGVCSDGPDYTCLCKSGWTGADCATATCPGIPACNTPYGKCNTATGVCTCLQGYTGDACEVAPGGECGNPPCNNNGTCKDKTCTCYAGWQGPQCATPAVAPTTCPGTPPCSNNGVCNTATGVCACSPGWASGDCGTAVPHGGGSSKTVGIVVLVVLGIAALAWVAYVMLKKK